MLLSLVHKVICLHQVLWAALFITTFPLFIEGRIKTDPTPSFYSSSSLLLLSPPPTLPPMPPQPIIGGVPATYGLYPYFTLALRRNGRFFCGGTLISPEFILTAAHCALGPFFWAKLLIGALCPSQSDNCGQYSEYKDVQKIIAHPKYNSTTVDNDFALVQLTSRSLIEPVTLDTGDISTQYNQSKRNLYAVGFGRESSTNPNLFPNHLMQVELGYIPSDTCDTSYSGGNGTKILSSMMCASDPGQDSCNGDSGGPLYDQENHVQVGIVSWGDEVCASPTYPGVYSRIADQYIWIRDTVCYYHTLPKPDFCPFSFTVSVPPTTIQPSTIPPSIAPSRTHSPTILPSISPSLPTKGKKNKNIKDKKKSNQKSMKNNKKKNI